MQEKNQTTQKKRKSARLPNKKQYGVSMKILCGLFALMFLVATVRFAYVKGVKGQEYQLKATQRETVDDDIESKRGTIYDINGNVLAESAGTYCVKIDTKSFLNNTDLTKKDKQNKRDYVVKTFGREMGISTEKMEKYFDDKNGSIVLKEHVEFDEVQRLKGLCKFMAVDDTGSQAKYSCFDIVAFPSDSTRYYRNDFLASGVLGFTRDDGAGAYGLEYEYNDELAGVSGRKIQLKTGDGIYIPDSTISEYPAKQGQNLILSLDTSIQAILTDVLTEAYNDTGALGVYGIVQNPSTGAILGMISLPDFNSNDPYTLRSAALKERNEQIKQESKTSSTKENEKIDNENLFSNSERNLAYNEQFLAKFKSEGALLDYQWNNKCVSYTYEPGSVFKTVTVSAALEEAIANSNREYYCDGDIDLGYRKISCWTDGHGMETFAELLKNSCNPFTVTVAFDLGKEKFYNYVEAFGFTEKTGIDLPGETVGEFYSRDDFSESDLASSSFGQTFETTPIQMINAVSCIANGGKLMTPYIVEKMTDENSNVTFQHEPKIRRQVISEQTAQTVRDYMEAVVPENSNAYAAGYHVAGKTGTAEIRRGMTDEEQDTMQYVASFCGFAPSYDPKISVLVIVDSPIGDHGGSKVASPLAGEIIERVLTYMGVERSYTDDELERLQYSVPSVTSSSLNDAEEKVAQHNYQYVVVGEGETVTSQYPAAGTTLEEGGIVVLYTEGSSPKLVTVPDVSGMTYYEARDTLRNVNLNISVARGTSSYGDMTAYKQSIIKNTTVQQGEIVNVSFRTVSDDIDN